jgi:putative restriction endonuclease
VCGVADDYRIVVREDILTEEDGPMLLHGLQGLHGQLIQRPRSPELRPDPELLAVRYDRFLQASSGP